MSGPDRVDDQRHTHHEVPVVPQGGHEFDLRHEQAVSGGIKLEPEEIYAIVSPSVVAMKAPSKTEDGEEGMMRHRRSMDLDDPIPSYGSGFVYDQERRLVVTNWHVAEVEDELLVEVGDHTLPAKVVGVDPRLDLAVLKIEGEVPLPQSVKTGSPADLAVGERVYTIGSPFGFDGTFGQGMVSGPQRAMHGPGGVMVGLVQHNAITNPGNSGGVLLNQRGEVVGVNTMILSRSGGHQGFALSVPMDLIEESIEQLLTTGRIMKPSLGMTIAETQHGLAIAHVEPGGAAELAGLASEIGFKRQGPLRRGEAIDFSKTLFVTHIDGRLSDQESDLLAAIARNKGEPVRLDLRLGLGTAAKSFSVDVTPAKIEVRDVVSIRESMKKFGSAGPSCEHISILGENERYTDEDIDNVLSESPVALILRENNSLVAAAKHIGGRILGRSSHPQDNIEANVYMNRHQVLARLVEIGKSVRWLEDNMEALGFKQTEAGDRLAFHQALSDREAVRISAMVHALVHGADPKEIEKKMGGLGGLMGPGGGVIEFGGPVPPEMRDMLEDMLRGRGSSGPPR